MSEQTPRGAKPRAGGCEGFVGRLGHGQRTPYRDVEEGVWAAGQERHTEQSSGSRAFPEELCPCSLPAKGTPVWLHLKGKEHLGDLGPGASAGLGFQSCKGANDRVATL